MRRSVLVSRPRRVALAFGTALAVMCSMLPAAAGAAAVTYACGYNLCRIDSNGGGAQQITSDGTAVGAYRWPSLSRDGSRMAWIRGNGSLYLGDATAHASGGSLTGLAQMAVIRPDGAQVAALRTTLLIGSTGLYAHIYDASGEVWSGPQPDLSSLGWAADNAHLLLPWSYSDTSGVGICIAVSDTSGTTMCDRRVASTPGAYLNDPALSPDGRILAVTVLTDSLAATGRIALYDYNTGTLLRDLTNATTDALPAWSPDGREIAFQRGTSIYVIAAGGPPGSERLLAADGQTPTWGPSTQQPGPGQSSNPPNPGTTPLPAPSLTGLRVAPRSFPAARRGPTVTPARATGAKVTYRLSGAATVTFTVQRAEPGILRGGRCLPPARSKQHGKACIRYSTAGSFARPSRFGPNAFHFTGRVRGRMLAPGSYRLAAVARTGTGPRSTPAYAQFRLVR